MAREKRSVVTVLMIVFMIFASIMRVMNTMSEETSVMDDATRKVNQAVELETYDVVEIAQEALESIAYIDAYGDFKETYAVQGSGFLMDSSGIIVTNYHVIEGAASLVIELGENRYRDDEIRILAAEEEWDLALLKIDVQIDCPPLKLGQGISQVRLGETVVAMGNPEGLKGTASDGIVSAVGRDVGMSIDLIQTTAPISKGSSGGPLLNLHGEVIGVNTLTIETGQNLNFAIPAEYILDLLDREPINAGVGDYFESRYHAQGGETEDSVKGVDYKWMPGNFAVVLSWEDSIDLDLELWTGDLEFVGHVSSYGRSPDIVDGSQGDEWIILNDTGIELEDYIIAVYNNDWTKEDETELTLEIYYPDGHIEEISAVIYSVIPYDQWYGFKLNTRTLTVKHLDFFFDSETVALLEWDTETDLDLVVYSHDLEQWFLAGDTLGLDAVNGLDAIESFQFGNYSEYGGQDLTVGKMDLVIRTYEAVSVPTRVMVQLLHSDGTVLEFNHVFQPGKADDLWYLAGQFSPAWMTYEKPGD
ncbi:MAG: hypothetical protein AVO33_04535 [delta proteobacterium ML8_F1]|nr:MAG: hypothetical protein AVO33_04535 [delta proteobacterium ML8_F1]